MLDDVAESVGAVASGGKKPVMVRGEVVTTSVATCLVGRASSSVDASVVDVVTGVREYFDGLYSSPESTEPLYSAVKLAMIWRMTCSSLSVLRF